MTSWLCSSSADTLRVGFICGEDAEPAAILFPVLGPAAVWSCLRGNAEVWSYAEAFALTHPLHFPAGPKAPVSASLTTVAGWSP